MQEDARSFYVEWIERFIYFYINDLAKFENKTHTPEVFLLNLKRFSTFILVIS